MWRYRGQKRPDFAILPGPGQESVWDYPRPPKLASDSRLVEVYSGNQVVVRSVRTCRVLETASPPTFYIPPQDVNWDLLVSAPGISVCELNKKLTNSFIVLVLSMKTTTNYRLPFKWGRSKLKSGGYDG